MGRGQQDVNLLYGTRQKGTRDLAARTERRFNELASVLGSLGSGEPDMSDVAAFESLIEDCRVPEGGATPALIPYSSWVRERLELHTWRPPGPADEEVEERGAALRRGRVLIARASHRMTDPILGNLIGSYVEAELATGDGWQSLSVPLASLMEMTPLRHRSCPVVYRRLMEPYGKYGARRAPEGKYLVHYSAGGGRAMRHGKALCGTSLTMVGNGGDWNTSTDGRYKVTCERCRRALNTRPGEVEMAVEDEGAQLGRLHTVICARTKRRVRRDLSVPHAVPLSPDVLEAGVRTHAWRAVVTELQATCQRWDHPLSSRTIEVLNRVPQEPGLLEGLREGAIPEIVF